MWGAMACCAEGEGALAQFMALVVRNGFLASLVVRLVPFAPFVVVNMAAGVTPIGALDFAAGTAIGILPKIVLTSLAGTRSAAPLPAAPGASPSAWWSWPARSGLDASPRGRAVDEALNAREALISSPWSRYHSFTRDEEIH